MGWPSLSSEGDGLFRFGIMADKMIQYLLLLSVALPVAIQQPPAELQQRVTAFWDALVSRDKVAALQFVIPSAQNDFIQRKEPLFRSWKLKQIEVLDETRARVSVDLERISQSGQAFGFSTVTENWVLRDGTWLASIGFPDQKAVLEVLTNQTTNQQVPLTGRFRSLPSSFKIFFLSAQQVGWVRLQNEKSTPVEVQSISIDEEQFRLLEAPESIPPRSRAVLRLEFIGEEIKKNLESELVLRYRSEQEQETLRLQIHYNVFSDGARGLFGLTREEADKLPRGAVPTPVIRIPDEAKKPVRPPPER